MTTAEPAAGAGGEQDERLKGRPAGPLVRECAPPYTRRSGQIAAVLLYGNGGHSVMWPDRREDRDKPWFREPFTVFEVLLGRNVTVFELRLPAAGDAQFFEARAEVHWEVEDPYTVVSKRVWDLRELLEGELLYGLRQVSRRFRLTEAQRADEAVRAELAAGHPDLGRDLGLRLTTRVFVDLSDPIRQRLGERDEIHFDMTTEEAQAEAERRREAHQRRLARDRAAELESVLKRGEEAEIIYHMARNPEKEWEIRQAIRQEKRQGQADFINLFNRLIDRGILERHDIDDGMYEVLQHLRESTGGVIGGVTDRVLSTGPARRELEDGPRPGRPGRYRDERPGGFRDEDGGDHGGGGRRGGGDGPRDPDGYRDDRDRHPGPYRDDRGRPPEPELPPWDEEPRIHRPTRVESAAERAQEERRAREEQREREEQRGGAGRRSRPSADFDDWDDT
ncbi:MULTISPECIES: hypothetical protein [Streptomyces]|uniref:PE-PGRS family protein n=2 Tax=Streptomyces TaxID=1883 RepID=A0A3R7FYU3_9ACTN|nr:MULTISPECIES: hypothetical protein [Streptomyces]KNE79206.1 hypothetical protein ADZ36_28885 [Streptomyces fradiae]PQM22880.1 hypothetical protein Sfr7A_14460 [Streptomyces xinghaiensis]RKM97353.1 hypothetical protein SFRA_009060 [Streptomyces xinghaiensis]RNC73812.1 hypothetical protein DC095_013080 [Streptomyces xinghaiensis]